MDSWASTYSLKIFQNIYNTQPSVGPEAEDLKPSLASVGIFT